MTLTADQLLAELKGTRCDRCNEFIEQPRDELQNESMVTVSGGYGSFVDDITHAPMWSPYEYIYCEACSMAMARFMGMTRVIFEHHTSTICKCADRDDYRTPGDSWAECQCPVCVEYRGRRP